MVRLGKIDPNSYSEPERIITVHSMLEWTLDFNENKLKGHITHRFKVLDLTLTSIVLDVRDISVSEVTSIAENITTPLKFFVSDAIPNIGEKLTLELPKEIVTENLVVRINYETSANASGLQWLSPEQTLGKEQPYMFSQFEAIHARSALPCQDTPAVKFTYEAIVQHPRELTALMSAIREQKSDGVTKFVQSVPIPSYLIAIAVGQLVCKPIGSISNVWSEIGIIDTCAEEFSQTNEMLEIASDICGEYVWKQYDLLVMPPSFPYGGMENPCLTFVTPTLVVGDKSLAIVVAHEIAHSWTGNLVTNKNFEHFWLNEGFTVFVEGKIIGRLLGQQEQDFHMIRELAELRSCLDHQLKNHPECSTLIVDLSDCGPDDTFSKVPYAKGSVLLRYIEDLVGGPEIFEPFLKFYLQKHAYKSITTEDFQKTLASYFTNEETKQKLSEIDWDLWLTTSGMPPFIPKLDDTLTDAPRKLVYLWSFTITDELRDLEEIKITISTHQMITFLSQLIDAGKIANLNENKIQFLEETYNLRDTKNFEIKCRLIRLYIKARLMNRMDEILNFVNSSFRMKFCRPIYRDLEKWPEAKPIAIENFNKVKNQMMTVCSYGIQKDLKLI